MNKGKSSTQDLKGTYKVPKVIQQSSQGTENTSSQKQQSTTISIRQKMQGLLTSNPRDCIFCQKFSTYRSFNPLLNRALYSKYSSSQNYYYSKDINDILGNASTSSVIIFRDLETLDEEQEYLKRFYKRSEYQFQIEALTQYYKYHKDIARLFMIPISIIMNRFHDQRRRVQYLQIKKMLNLESSEESENQDKDQFDDQQSEQPKPLPPGLENVLASLDISLPYHQKDSYTPNNLTHTNNNNINAQSYNNFQDQLNFQKKNTKQETDIDRASQFGKPGVANKNYKNQEQNNKDRDQTENQTIHDITAKLSEIIKGNYANAQDYSRDYISIELSRSHLQSFFQNNQEIHQISIIQKEKENDYPPEMKFTQNTSNNVPINSSNINHNFSKNGFSSNNNNQNNAFQQSNPIENGNPVPTSGYVNSQQMKQLNQLLANQVSNNQNSTATTTPIKNINNNISPIKSENGNKAIIATDRAGGQTGRANLISSTNKNENKNPNIAATAPGQASTVSSSSQMPNNIPITHFSQQNFGNKISNAAGGVGGGNQSQFKFSSQNGSSEKRQFGSENQPIEIKFNNLMNNNNEKPQPMPMRDDDGEALENILGRRRAHQAIHNVEVTPENSIVSHLENNHQVNGTLQQPDSSSSGTGKGQQSPSKKNSGIFKEPKTQPQSRKNSTFRSEQEQTKQLSLRKESTEKSNPKTLNSRHPGGSQDYDDAEEIRISPQKISIYRETNNYKTQIDPALEQGGQKPLDNINKLLETIKGTKTNSSSINDYKTIESDRNANPKKQYQRQESSLLRNRNSATSRVLGPHTHSNLGASSSNLNIHGSQASSRNNSISNNNPVLAPSNPQPSNSTQQLFWNQNQQKLKNQSIYNSVKNLISDNQKETLDPNLMRKFDNRIQVANLHHPMGVHQSSNNNSQTNINQQSQHGIESNNSNYPSNNLNILNNAANLNNNYNISAGGALNHNGSQKRVGTSGQNITMSGGFGVQLGANDNISGSAVKISQFNQPVVGNFHQSLHHPAESSAANGLFVLSSHITSAAQTSSNTNNNSRTNSSNKNQPSSSSSSNMIISGTQPHSHFSTYESDNYVNFNSVLNGQKEKHNRTKSQETIKSSDPRFNGSPKIKKSMPEEMNNYNTPHLDQQKNQQSTIQQSQQMVSSQQFLGSSTGGGTNSGGYHYADSIKQMLDANYNTTYRVSGSNSNNSGNFNPPFANTNNHIYSTISGDSSSYTGANKAVPSSTFRNTIQPSPSLQKRKSTPVINHKKINSNNPVIIAFDSNIEGNQKYTTKSQIIHLNPQQNATHRDQQHFNQLNPPGIKSSNVSRGSSPFRFKEASQFEQEEVVAQNQFLTYRANSVNPVQQNQY